MFSCREYTMKEYINFCMNNKDYVKTWTDSTYYVAAIYKTSELLAFEEINRDKSELTKEIFAEYKNRFDNGVYFNIRIGLNNGESLLEIDAKNKSESLSREAYFSKNYQNEVYIEAGSRILNALYYNYYNPFKIKPDAEFLFVFPKEVLQYESFKLYVNCRAISSFSTIALEFEPAKLSKNIKIKF